MDKLEKELIQLFDEFQDDLNKHNDIHSPIEDDKEPTLENFIRWLRFRQLQ